MLVDVEMWEKIVLNLLSNALKFTLEGFIWVLERARGEIVLQIADSGSGIAEEAVPRLFERFYRVSDNRGRSHEGSGIGLALVARAGDVARERGLPSTHPPAAAPPSSSGSRTVKQTARLSSQMPSPLAGWYLDEALESDADPLGEGVWPECPGRHGAGRPRRDGSWWSTTTPTCGRCSPACWSASTSDHRRRRREALELIRPRPPDLILTDVMMPELDGFGLLEALRGPATASSR